MLYRYRLYEADGADIGEVHYAAMVEAGDLIFTGDGRNLRVVDVMPFEEEDRSPVYAAIRVAPAQERLANG